ncbi:MAG: RNA polymerase sigma factor [Ruminococcaceae bacterium]|nr:RNA polymerase sigma factor [Oscillospiraceae bacterium]
MTKYAVMNDETLVEICLLGESGAFEELVMRHENAVMNTAKRVTGSRFTAEDASQDAFVSAWMRLDSLRDRSKFRPWVCAIAKNCAMALLTRYRSVVPDISLHLVENEEMADNPDPELSALISTENDEELHALVDALGEKLRETIRLHYFEGYSVAEIADLLSVPVGTVKWRLAEGRKQLRKGYGIVEKEYNENETLVSRVMRQVEELKLWQLRSDKTGFEEEYENVLAAVESLEESKEKQHMLADVWLRAAWWIPGKANDEVYKEIKEAAIKGHNEDVMEAIVSHGYTDVKSEKSIRYFLETIPELEAGGFRKALGYAWFWLGYEYRHANRMEDAFAAFDKVLEVLEPSNVYYANALAAIRTEKKLAEAVAAGVTNAGIGNMGETYRKIGGKWYFWDEPGYRAGELFWDLELSPMFWLSRCDELIDDPALQPGVKKTASDGRTTLTCRAADKPVTTPAGTFENCLIFEVNGDYRTQTVIAPGVGIVEQTDRKAGTRFVLTAYKVEGEGRIPFAVGNRWEYHADNPAYLVDDEQVMEIVFASEDQVTASVVQFVRKEYNTDTWHGNTLAARQGYCKEDPDNPDNGILVDVEKYLAGAERTAKTRREKVHTAVANKVMRSIFETDDVFNPAYTEKLRWTFFELYAPWRKGDSLCLGESDRTYSFELKDWFWKDGKSCFDMFAVGCNFLYDIVNFALGALWSDKWIPGYSEDRKFKQYGDMDVSGRIKVCEDEAVETPVGSFPACRHLVADMQGGLGYWSGHTEFWYAEGVGLVKFLRTVTECGEPWKNAIWLLMEMTGTGEGFFPAADGFFRKYEAQGLENGYHGYVEYTYLEDEQGLTIYKAAFGTQDREEYEKVK